MYDKVALKDNLRDKRAETLESASSKTVGKFLHRAKRRKGNSTDLKTVLDVGQTQVPLSTCGAPATLEELPNQNEHSEVHDDQHEVGWEDVGGEHGGAVQLRDNDISIAVDLPEQTLAEPENRKRRVTKKDRELAQLIHRTHLLCLLGRGLFLDMVANDPIIQALVSSLLPEHLLSPADPSSCDENRARSLLHWFHSEFKRSPKPRSSLDTMNESNSLRSAQPQVINELRASLLQKLVTVEEGCLLFAALLRSLGYLARIVCVLEPLPLNPSQKDSLHAHRLEAAHGLPLASTYESHKDSTTHTVASNSKQRKKRERKDGEGDGSQDCSMKMAGDKNSVKTQPKNKEHQRKRKGDEEFEHQLAMALAATAFQDSSNPEPREQRLHQKNTQKRDTLPGGLTTGLAYNSRNDGTGKFWVEIYVKKSPIDGFRWVHACPSLGWFDRCRDVEGLAPRRLPFAYVVAFCGGGAKDVTRRYSLSFIKSEKQREGAWWEETLKPLRSKQVASSVAVSVAGEKGHVMEAREEKELEALALAERRSLPSTVEGFRKHPLYVLDRHIGKYQVLRPGSKPLGMHRGESYYSREDVCDVHTADRWRRLGRQVVDDEVANPAKRMKKRTIHEDKGLNDPNDGSGTSDDLLSCFYGYWQTEEWMPPAATDGRVPKNERGNVEAPPFAAALPHGTVHIQLPNIFPICRKLGIDFAPALVGFEVRGGRSVPVIDGVVICLEHEEALRKAFEEDMNEKAEKARVKRLHQAASNWRALLRAILTRVRLKASYSSGTEMKAEMEAGAMLSFETEVAYNYSRKNAQNAFNIAKVSSPQSLESLKLGSRQKTEAKDADMVSDDQVEEI